MRLKRWFLNNFVLICEVVGYILSLSVIGFALVSMFIRVEVLQPVSGVLQPVRVAVATPAESGVLEFLVKRGAEVSTGTALCRVVSGDAQVSAALSARSLAMAADRLGASESAARAELEGTLAALRKRLDGGGGVRTIAAPAAGVFIPTPEGEAVEPVAAGVAVANIVTPGEAELSGPLPAQKAARVEVGAPAHAKVPGIKAGLGGRVASVAPDGDSRQITVRFAPIPADLGSRLLAGALDAGQEAEASVSAQVVVGSQSLFSKLFSRRQ